MAPPKVTHPPGVYRRSEVGLKGDQRVKWHVCPECGTGRWASVQFYPERCRSCSSRENMRESQKLGTKAAHRPDCRCMRCRVTAGELVGAANPSWRGGRKGQTSGYIYLLLAAGDWRVPMAGANRYVLEHRAVMAESLGRCLEPQEYVHHVNGRRDDNRLANLELWQRPQPSGIRAGEYHCPGCRCGEGD